MSASQDKKRRTEERALGTERRQVASQKEAKERKQSKIKWTVGSIIVVLLVAAILIGNSSLFYTARPALQVGDVKYSSAEVNYAYRTAYLSFCNQYGSYLTYEWWGETSLAELHDGLAYLFVFGDEGSDAYATLAVALGDGVDEDDIVLDAFEVAG